MLAFLINLCCTKVYHSIRIVEHHRNIFIIIIIIIISKTYIFTETRNQDCFRVCDLSSCNLLAETNNFVLYAVLLSCLVSSYRNHIHRDSNPGQFLLFETNNFALSAVLLSCLVSELQELPSSGLGVLID
jgi:vesicle coat complex subunit